MSFRINTNVQALVAQRHLGNNVQAQGRSIEKLASGQRITKAADDAAGLAITEKMRAQIRSVRQDVRNANDGISMIQTAEGGMNEIGNILIRFRELAIQSASDTVSNTERGFIEKEIRQLHSEVDRITNTTEFNGMKLLAGGEAFEGRVLEFQVGTQNDPKNDRFIFDLDKALTSTEQLGLTEFSAATKVQAQNSLAMVDNAITHLSSNRSELGALQNRLQSTISNLKIYDENLSAARSQIIDVDVADETAQLTKNNILTQSSTSVLTQANNNAMGALKLLG